MSADYLEIQKKRGIVRKKFRLHLFLGAIFLFLLFNVACRALNSYGEVSAIEIRGNHRVSNDALIKNASSFVMENIGQASYVYKILGIKNFLSWYATDWNNFKLRDPRLANALVSFDLFHKLIIFDVIERDIFAIWCSKEKCFWFDEGGYLIAPAPETYGRLVLKIIDTSNRDIKLGDLILEDPALLSNFISVINFIEENKINANSIVFDNLDNQSMLVHLDRGPDIYFSLRFKPDWAKYVFSSLSSSNKFLNLEYIDFRVQNRVYYK